MQIQTVCDQYADSVWGLQFQTVCDQYADSVWCQYADQSRQSVISMQIQYGVNQYAGS